MGNLHLYTHSYWSGTPCCSWNLGIRAMFYFLAFNSSYAFTLWQNEGNWKWFPIVLRSGMAFSFYLASSHISWAGLRLVSQLKHSFSIFFWMDLLNCGRKIVFLICHFFLQQPFVFESLFSLWLGIAVKTFLHKHCNNNNFEEFWSLMSLFLTRWFLC